MLEEVDRLLYGLPGDLRCIVMWKLEGYTNAEIARMIGRTVRSVELKMQDIRECIELGLRQTENTSDSAPSR